MRLTTLQPPEPGTALEVAPGVRWARMPIPTPLGHVNLWLLADGPDWTAVDTGIATPAAKEAWERLLEGHTLRRLIATHFHPDHLGLAGWLEEKVGVPLWITFGEYATAQLFFHGIAGFAPEATQAFFRSHGLEEARIQSRALASNLYRLGAPTLPHTFRPIRDGEPLLIGDRGWQVICGHGHSPDHASLYCAEAGVLISGDMLLPRISTNVSAFAAIPDNDPLGLFLDSLGRLEVLPAETLVLPSHGVPFRGLHARIAQLRQHHASRCAALQQACVGVSLSAAELIPVVFERPITDPFQTLFAMGECIAHLAYLEHRGLLWREVDGEMVRFRGA
jgi:glyoxylase-like metal-dependent hydrolase (beta-lactamase superfamily II)